MPRTRRIEVPFVRVQRLLLGYGLNAPALAKVLDCSSPTARAKLKRPETFTLADFDKICRRGNVPMDELRAAIQK